ncbi:MAG: NUDIX domain-containing protein [Clostridiales bacterium]|nr:NUDIX domain-containing protein [Clostridiales bacterium]
MKGEWTMLGKHVRVNITNAINSQDSFTGRSYLLNYGSVEGIRAFGTPIKGAYIMGLNRAVNRFDGLVIAVVKQKNKNESILIVASKDDFFIDTEIKEALSFALNPEDYNLDCLYEKSCGAVVYRLIRGRVRFLLIKNKRSMHWGFPKGHVEANETPRQTAIREVFEEVGLEIDLLPEFESQSEYVIQKKIKKCVTLFLAKTAQKTTKIQEEEIGDYAWLEYDKALERLRFENDRRILKQAAQYLREKSIL